MYYPGFRAAPAQFRRDLKLAAWIREYDVVRAGHKNVVGFARGEFSSQPRLSQIVGAGGAATEIGLGHLDERHAGDRREQFSRRLADSKSMREMTRVVIGHGASALAPSRSLGRGEQ